MTGYGKDNIIVRESHKDSQIFLNRSPMGRIHWKIDGIQSNNAEGLTRFVVKPVMSCLDGDKLPWVCNLFTAPGPEIYK